MENIFLTCKSDSSKKFQGDLFRTLHLKLYCHVFVKFDFFGESINELKIIEGSESLLCTERIS